MSDTPIVADGTGLEQAEPLIPALPVKRNEGGLDVIDWDRLIPEEATLPAAAALVQYEVGRLSSLDHPHDLVRAERVVRASDMIIDRVADGTLATMGDVSCMIDFVVDNNPKLSRVGELFDEGRSMTDVAQIYELREVMSVSLGSVTALYEAFNFGFDDYEAGEALALAIDRVLERSGLDERFRDIGAKKVIDLAQSGKTLMDILDL